MPAADYFLRQLSLPLPCCAGGDVEHVLRRDTAAAVEAELASLFEDLVERALVLWIALVGAVSFGLLGHVHRVVTDHAADFDRVMAVAAEGAGLTLSLN